MSKALCLAIDDNAAPCRKAKQTACVGFARCPLHFFNTSGIPYRSLGLKERLPAMSEDEQLALLATDGMLVKRPLLVAGGMALPGFRPGEWAGLLGL